MKRITKTDSAPDFGMKTRLRDHKTGHSPAHGFTTDKDPGAFPRSSFSCESNSLPEVLKQHCLAIRWSFSTVPPAFFHVGKLKP
jgi:hypothetical protein